MFYKNLNRFSLFKKETDIYLLLMVFSYFMIIQNIKSSEETIQPLDRVEFGFCLLADEKTSEEIQILANIIPKSLENLDKRTKPTTWGDYFNQVVRIPHVSIGQYGCLGIELPKLKQIVDETAKKFKPLTEMMLQKLSVTDENIFLDFNNIKENTTPQIKEMYNSLREQYMKLPTKFPIAQALVERYQNLDNNEEIELIDKYYQNWGTPEKNRIRPHFTLFYNYDTCEEAIRKTLSKVEISSSLNTVSFSTLAIMRIDIWGNPTQILHEAKLGG